MLTTPDIALVLLLAMALDGAIGDPAWLYRRVPHPVALLGRLVHWLDRMANRDTMAASTRRLAGTASLAVAVAASAGAGWTIHRALAGFDFGWTVESLVMSAFIAQRGLYRHVAAVADGLDRGLAQGRAAVALIVGRDPDSLDEAAVGRAALESLAENYSDGVVAPAFWALVGGLPALLAYKAINTADSMIGHRTPRHAEFGWAAARLDDWANLVPARLSGLLLAAAALPMPGADALGALKAMRRDARRHRSPNAGWQEAALAGALGLALAGPRRYQGGAVEDAWMGDGRALCTAADIRRGLTLYVIACLFAATAVGALALV